MGSSTSLLSGDNSITKRNNYSTQRKNDKTRNNPTATSYSCLEEIDAYSKITTILFRNKNGKFSFFIINSKQLELKRSVSMALSKLIRLIHRCF